MKRRLKVLITGIAGFAGSHLADLLVGIGDVEVSGTVHSGCSTSNIDHLRGRLQLFEGDLCDADFVERTLDETQPDYVFHLAAQSAVPISISSPLQTLINNIAAQTLVLEAARKLSSPPRLLVVGSGDEYGLVYPNELPIKETNPFRPASPYAVSKVAQDLLGYQYYLSHRLPVVRVRPFNHIGPRQTDAFVTSSFAKQIASAELGISPPVVKVGNLEAKRDFTDVRDVVRAYWLVLQNGKVGDVYNIGSGRSHRISEVLELLMRESTVALSVETDPSRLRPSDVPEVVCDYSKLHKLTGWEPIIPLEQSLRDLLQYWREQLRRKV